MKSILTIIGTVLVIFGIIGFSYKYFYYTTNEKVAEIGSVKVTTERDNVIVISPLVSAVMIGAGIFLVIIGVSRKG